MGEAASQTLYLIRHGHPASSWGGEDADPGLDALGKRQADRAAERLLASPIGERPIRVISSPSRRCRETARPLAEALAVRLEIDPAIGEIPTPAALAQYDRPAWLQEAMGGRWRDIVGDLNYDSWRRSVAQAVSGYAGAAVFSHFVAINAILSVLSSDDQVIGFRPDHASITILAVDRGGLRLVSRGAEAATGVL